MESLESMCSRMSRSYLDAVESAAYCYSCSVVWSCVSVRLNTTVSRTTIAGLMKLSFQVWSCGLWWAQLRNCFTSGPNRPTSRNTFTYINWCTQHTQRYSLGGNNNLASYGQFLQQFMATAYCQSLYRLLIVVRLPELPIGSGLNNWPITLCDWLISDSLVFLCSWER